MLLLEVIMDKASTFNECVLLCDQASWVWGPLSQFLDKHKLPYLHLESKHSIRKSWSRIHKSPKFILHWDSAFRHGGAVIEELLTISPNFDIEDRLVVVTSDLNIEDNAYFAELGITNVITVSSKQLEMRKALQKLHDFFYKDLEQKVMKQKVWRKLLSGLNNLSEKSPPASIEKIQGYLRKVGAMDRLNSERYFHAFGVFHDKLGNSEKAYNYWQKALEINPNHYPAKDALVNLYCQQGKHKEALALLRQMQTRNKHNVSRLVKIGEIHSEMRDNEKAEHYFNSALTKDQFCGGALNGLAIIRFEQGKTEESRRLLAQSAIANKIASRLNSEGVNLVKAKKYEEALNHYTKAQYVLPQQDKDPMLFYNIGLCYSRWGKPEPACQFLQLALIKEPNYKKAEKLLNQISQQSTA